MRFFEHFDYNGHTCLVFEHMSFNLYELLKRTKYQGVSLMLIRKFARQVLKSLAFLRLPEVDVCHCDLKPENILFRAPHRSAIKVSWWALPCLCLPACLRAQPLTLLPPPHHPPPLSHPIDH